MSSREQAWSSETYGHNARFVSDLGQEILNWLAPQAGERILDLGCGDGVLSEKISATGATVVGIDASDDFIAAARKRGIDAKLVNAEKMAFDTEFDAVFSNAAMHWMLDQNAVIAGVSRALRPGGRFVGEFGGHGNVAAIVTALRAVADKYGLGNELSHPWVYPTTKEHAARLKAHGFKVERIEIIPRPTPLTTGMRGWLATFRKPFFDQLPREQGEKALSDVCDLLQWSLCDEQGQWTADYVRLRFEAIKM